MEMIMQNMMMQQPSAPSTGKDLMSGLKDQTQESGSDMFAQMMEAAGEKTAGQTGETGKDDALIQSLAGQFMQNMAMNPLMNMVSVDTAVQTGIPAEMQVTLPVVNAENVTAPGNTSLAGEQISAGNMTPATDTGAVPTEIAAAADRTVVTENRAEPVQNTVQPVTDTGTEQTASIPQEASKTQSETPQQDQTYAGMTAAADGKTKTENDAKTSAEPETMQFQTAAGSTAARVETPVQQNTAASETLQFHTTDQAENIQKLTELIKNAVDSQVREVEIQLEPANLGKITLKAVYEGGKAAVVISCTNQAALEALSGKAAELGGLLQERMGGQTEIIVEQPQQQYLNQDGRSGNQEAREEQRQQKKQNSRPQTGDFLEQLRLGLI